MSLQFTSLGNLITVTNYIIIEDEVKGIIVEEEDIKGTIIEVDDTL